MFVAFSIPTFCSIFFIQFFLLFCHIKYSEQQKSQQTPDKQSRGAIMRKSNQKKKKKLQYNEPINAECVWAQFIIATTKQNA